MPPDDCQEALKRIGECARRRNTVLDLSRLGLTRLPEKILQLSKLTELDLSHNALATLPPEITDLVYLTRLDLSSNTLDFLPPSVGRLAELTTLDASANRLETLPPEIGNLTRLTRLDLSSNKLRALPSAIGQLTKLTRLYLAHNRLDALPPEIAGLTGLTRLYLSHNLLGTLPPTLGRLASLTRLDLSHNQLGVIPPEIGQLAKLTVCDLSHNLLDRLPREFGGLAKLTVLWLMSNRLADLPDEFRELVNLETLFLHDNPALQLAPSVLGADPRINEPRRLPAQRSTPAKAVLDFYLARKAGKTRPLNEAKIILLGRSGVGKTTIAQALRDLPFRDHEESTPGIALSDATLDGHGGLPVTAHVWDCSGQAITHALHPMFFSARALFVLVLAGHDARDSNDAHFWLRLIETHGTDDSGHGPSVVVALNQWNVPGGRSEVDRAELRARYPFIRGFVEMDCKGKKGVPVLKATLSRELERMPWVREPIPESWDAVRRALSETRKWSQLSDAAYRELCIECGVIDEGQQDYLAEILHHLGCALNDRNDPRLPEPTTLHPESLTRHVYALMHRASRQTGVLTQTDVESLLYTEKDAASRAALMNHLERLEIVRQVQSTAGDRWLLPAAMPPAPALDVFGDAADASPLRFSYQNMPPTLVERLIARRYDFIEKLGAQPQCWRLAVILARKGARALIQSEPSLGQITLTVTGPPKPRQQLFDLCQIEINDLNAENPIAIVN